MLGIQLCNWSPAAAGWEIQSKSNFIMWVNRWVICTQLHTLPSLFLQRCAITIRELTSSLIWELLKISSVLQISDGSDMFNMQDTQLYTAYRFRKFGHIVLVSAGIELIFLSVAAVFWIQYKKNVNTDVFSCCYEIKDFFPVSHIQLMSRCAGSGRKHSQAAIPSWPMEKFHTMDVILSLWMEVGLWGRSLLFSFPGVWILSCLGVRTFGGNFMEFAIFGFHNHCSGTGCELATRW